VRAASVLVVPGGQLFRLAVAEVDVGGLPASAAAVVPVVDDGDAVEDQPEPVVGCGAQVVHLGGRRFDVALELDDHVFRQVGAENVA